MWLKQAEEARAAGRDSLLLILREGLGLRS